MTTTNVFAELLIIGIETMGWIALLILSLFGYEWIDFSVFNHLVIAIPLAVAAYVLGIMMDRVSDVLLAGADHKIRKNVLGERVAQSFPQLRIYILAGVIFASLSFYAWRASSITYYLRLQTAFALLPDDWRSSKEEMPESEN